MSRPAHRRPAALAASALVLSLALGACGRQADAPPTPSASGAPITVVHGGEGLEAAVAAVLSRHLRLHGHAVADEDGVAVEQPAWSAAGGDTVAVVDTLALAVAADPAAALPSPPSPSSTPTGTEAGTSTDAVPTPSATPSATASTAAPSPTALPVGDPAADAPAAGRVLGTLLAGQTAAAGTPQDEAPAVLSSSAGVLRLTAVVTQTTAARLELESITDLNGWCESLTAVAPPPLTAAADPDAATALRARLDRLAGCRPETWLADTEDPTAAVVADEAQVALLTGTDPEIDANTLVPLEDDGRVLPEGRLTAVGSAATLDDDAERRIAEVMSALDGDGLRELERLTTGADPLPVAEAAQYWLVDQGLEDAPEDWFVPRGSWF
ncbi:MULTISPECIES: glycine betaine ABC transporter substrate-binding protein [Micrococcus]|uniref:Glycine betaine ABC transporter substrate-binding protein n=1 Tax=Micrococcus yunnanensis TaxID=566027 RepID=A0AAP5WDX6_9MICC|nr:MULTISPECIES: glycine betaine ABC transporter substrate-binding protein [Micrococcus]MDV7178110.1 glycine betaine ABC transporter substrate-binding protein [Micrococcus yunnanensis]MEB2536204.1 glycine betaine ABC transporter substrate-binding protein [Micrococcus luteus]WRQ44446.1 glycine betaine ABC transporter substrate-binding protein [Micrococcus sp. HOU1]